jgi:hypothetical protein
MAEPIAEAAVLPDTRLAHRKYLAEEPVLPMRWGVAAATV